MLQTLQKTTVLLPAPAADAPSWVCGPGNRCRSRGRRLAPGAGARGAPARDPPALPSPESRGTSQTRLEKPPLGAGGRWKGQQRGRTRFCTERYGPAKTPRSGRSQHPHPQKGRDTLTWLHTEAPATAPRHLAAARPAGARGACFSSQDTARAVPDASRQPPASICPDGLPLSKRHINGITEGWLPSLRRQLEACHAALKGVWLAPSLGQLSREPS